MGECIRGCNRGGSRQEAVGEGKAEDGRQETEGGRRQQAGGSREGKAEDGRQETEEAGGSRKKTGG
jgi:hypothetical protein